MVAPGPTINPENQLTSQNRTNKTKKKDLQLQALKIPQKLVKRRTIFPDVVACSSRDHSNTSAVMPQSPTPHNNINGLS